MSDLAPAVDLSLPLNPVLTAPKLGPDVTRAKIADTAKQFEAAFLSTMMNSMFDGLSTEGPTGGGPGEQAFRSFLSEAMSKQMVKHGGIGLAPTIQKEMLRLQGLSETPTSTKADPTKSNPSKQTASARRAQTAYAGVN